MEVNKKKKYISILIKKLVKGEISAKESKKIFRIIDTQKKSVLIDKILKTLLKDL